jgi:hypothetical protein
MANLFQVFFRFPIILVAEIVAIVYLSRRQVKSRLFVVLGSYLGFVAAAIAFALIVRDEFGFSFIPFVWIIWPWYQLLGQFPGPSTMKLPGLFIEALIGATLNCAIFYIIDRLSYPKHSAKIQAETPYRCRGVHH